MCAGMAMNPIDHPMGGGQGSQKVAEEASSGEPVGQLAKGFKTRTKHKPSDRSFGKEKGKKKVLIGSSKVMDGQSPSLHPERI